MENKTATGHVINGRFAVDPEILRLRKGAEIHKCICTIDPGHATNLQFLEF